MPRGSKGERRPADVVGAAVIRTAPAPGRWPGASTGAPSRTLAVTGGEVRVQVPAELPELN
jgi:hypothetical protein